MRRGRLAKAVSGRMLSEAVAGVGVATERRTDGVMNGGFFAMGGYAVFVWSSFGFALVAMLAVALHSLIAARRRRDELEELRRRVRRGDLALDDDRMVPPVGQARREGAAGTAK